jgi:hypothetical protein
MPAQTRKSNTGIADTSSRRWEVLANGTCAAWHEYPEALVAHCPLLLWQPTWPVSVVRALGKQFSAATEKAEMNGSDMLKSYSAII